MCRKQQVLSAEGQKTLFNPKNIETHNNEHFVIATQNAARLNSDKIGRVSRLSDEKSSGRDNKVNNDDLSVMLFLCT